MNKLWEAAGTGSTVLLLYCVCMHSSISTLNTLCLRVRPSASSRCLYSNFNDTKVSNTIFLQAKAISCGYSGSSSLDSSSLHTQRSTGEQKMGSSHEAQRNTRTNLKQNIAAKNSKIVYEQERTRRDDRSLSRQISYPNKLLSIAYPMLLTCRVMIVVTLRAAWLRHTRAVWYCWALFSCWISGNNPRGQVHSIFSGLSDLINSTNHWRTLLWRFSN